MSDDLADFLLDRIRSDEFQAADLRAVADLLRADNPASADLIEDTARQILTVGETKRVAAQRIRDSLTAGQTPSGEDIKVARAFAAAYRKHPDYRQEWAPHP